MKFQSSILLMSMLVTVQTIQAAPSSAYAGLESREIKALSAEEIQSYLKGKGAGFAKAAELNHYPGPAHVLELSSELQLSEVQRSHTQALFEVMQTGAMQLGKALVEIERELDRQFADRVVTRESLNTLLKDIGSLQAAIRHYHLQAHIEQRQILSAEQISKYDSLRGYGTGGTNSTHSHHAH